MTSGPTGQNPFQNPSWNTPPEPPQSYQPPYPQAPIPPGTTYPNQWQAPPPNRNRAWIIGLAVVAVVALAAVITIVVWPSSSDASPRAQMQTASSFPNKPTEQWKLRIVDVTSGRDSNSFASAEIYSAQPEAFEVDGHVILTTKNTDTGVPALISVNASNGKLEWSDTGDAKVCAHQLFDGRLACVARTGDSADYDRSEVVFRNIDTGAVEKSQSTDFAVTSIGVVDDSVITSGYRVTDGDSARVVSRGSADDLTALWTVSNSASATGCPGSGDSTDFQADPHAIVVGNGSTTWFLRTPDGTPLIDDALAWPSYQENGGIIGTRCTGDGTTGTLYVYSADGALLRSSATSSPTNIQRLGTSGTTRTPAPYIDQNRVLDLRTGQPAWPGADPLPTFFTSPATAELIGDTLIMEGLTSSSGGSHATGYSISTGEKLWDGLDFAIGRQYQWVTDGARVIGMSGGMLMSADLRTGKPGWIFAYSDGDQSAKLYPIGRGILIVADDAITYVTP